ncbi:YkgB family protein [Martelella soudanensis]|uniref:YkgB family protein n=1 Tax=Martelella sp. NC18 TaxID=2740297 RepID=UPI0015E0020B|nr:DUF417 family protein [Martelella sp. NC18]
MDERGGRTAEPQPCRNSRSGRRHPSAAWTRRFSNLRVAERSTGSYEPLALLRWALVVVFLWFGGMKFTGYEANGIAPFIQHSPILSWLNALLGVQGASYVIGVLELSTAAALIVGAFSPFASVIGAAMSCVTYVITLLFLLSTPGVAEPAAGGFPAISAPVGQFLLKDLEFVREKWNPVFPKRQTKTNKSRVCLVRFEPGRL